MAKQQKKALPEPKKAQDEKPTAVNTRKVEDGNRKILIFALAAAFLLGMGVQFIADNGLPRIHITWGEDGGGEQVDSSLAGWVKKNRPDLPADYPAAGRALWDTSDRLSSGVLSGDIDAGADTIARIQPTVSDPGVWREFCEKLSKRIGAIPSAELAARYKEAAQVFGVTSAFMALADISGGQEDEKGDNEASVPSGDSDCPVGNDGQDENEDQPGDGGEDRGALPPDETEDVGTRGTDAGSDAGQCPGGQCPAPVREYQKMVSPYNWFGGFGWF